MWGTVFKSLFQLAEFCKKKKPLKKVIKLKIKMEKSSRPNFVKFTF